MKIKIINVPGDKSISHRSIILASLCSGASHIEGFLKSDDTLATVECMKKLGAKIDISEDTVTVSGGTIKKPLSELYAGNSGTTARLISGILAAHEFQSVISGDESLSKRPMKRIKEPLEMMGAEFSGDTCPIKISGARLNGINYVSNISSAQVKSAVLIAGLFAASETVYTEPYKSRDHTERMMEAMGAKLKISDKSVTIYPGRLTASDIKIPGDISSAAFFMVLAAAGHNRCITITDVGVNPTRCGIIDVMKDMGADIEISNERVWTGETVSDITVKSSKLHGTEISGSVIPRVIDELPVIVIMSLFAEGTTVIKDAAELRVKESDRIGTICRELSKCGAKIEEKEDGMIIYGKNPLHGADFKVYNDHRLAMSFAILAEILQEKCSIDNRECVKISFPEFFEKLDEIRSDNNAG